MANQVLDSSQLAELQALEFAASCFPDLGVSRTERQRVRDLRGITAESVAEKWHLLENSMRGVLLKDVCRLSSFSRELLLELCRNWGRVWPQLKGKDENMTRAISVVVEHVLIPTIILVVRKHRFRGIGTELQPESFWYWPQTHEDGHVSLPVQRVLDYWLRTAGFRTARGVSREMPDSQSEPWRRKVNAWRKGRMPRYVSDLHELVSRFAERVTWLDEAPAWRTRFTLAWVCQKAWNKLAAALESGNPTFAQTLGGAFRANGTTPILHDENDLLVQPKVFFAVRLLEKHSPGVQKVLKTAPQQAQIGPFGLEVSGEEIERLEMEAAYKLNCGNLVVDFLRQRLANELRHSQYRHQNSADQMADYILNLGIRELNRMLRKPK